MSRQLLVTLITQQKAVIDRNNASAAIGSIEPLQWTTPPPRYVGSAPSSSAAGRPLLLCGNDLVYISNNNFEEWKKPHFITLQLPPSPHNSDVTLMMRCLTLRIGIVRALHPDDAAHGSPVVVMGSGSLHRWKQLHQSGSDDILEETGSRVQALLHHTVQEASFVVFAVRSASVGSGVTVGEALVDFIAPYFLDTPRVVVKGEWLLIPRRGGCGVAGVAPVDPSPLWFQVTDATGAAQSADRVGQQSWHGAVMLTDATRVEIQTAAAGPPILSGMSATSPHRRSQVEVVGNVPLLITAMTPARPPVEAFPLPRLQNQDCDLVLSPTPSPAFQPHLNCDKTVQTISQEAEREESDLKHNGASSSEREDAKYRKAMLQLIQRWSLLQRKMRSANLFSTIAKAILKGNDSLSSCDDDESITLRCIRMAHRETQKLRLSHEDLLRFLRDPAAHCRRRAVLRVSRYGVEGHEEALPCVDSRVTSQWVAKDSLEEQLTQQLNERYGLRCSSVFVCTSFDIAYCTLMDPWGTIIVDASRQLTLRVNGALISGRNRVADKRESCASIWHCSLLDNSIVEDLCHRRERRRRIWNALLTPLKHLTSPSLRQVVGELTREAEGLYCSLCHALGRAPVSSRQLVAMTDEDDFATEAFVDSVARANTLVNSLSVEQILSSLSEFQHLLDSQSETQWQALAEHDADGTQCAAVGAEEFVRRLHPGTQTADNVATAGEQLLAQFDESCAKLRGEMVRRLKESVDPSGHAQVQRERQNFLAVLKEVESKYREYGGLLFPFQTEFLPVIVPVVSLATDYQNVGALSRFLTASRSAKLEEDNLQLMEDEYANRAKQSGLPHPVEPSATIIQAANVVQMSVKEERHAFTALVRSCDELPRIPEYLNVVH